MTLDEIITDARSEMNEPRTIGHLGDVEYAAYANRAQDLIATLITESDQNFFEESDQTLGFIANQEEYDLPASVWDRKITRVTRTDLSIPKQLERIRFQDKERFNNFTIFSGGTDIQADVYYLRGNKLGIKPTPKTTIAANILLNFIQLPHELHWAEVGAPAATSFTMPTATSGAPPLMKAGRVSTTPNYYIGARMRIVTGVARGLERKITAYNVATRVATIDTAWTPADVTNVQYVLLTPIPLEHHDVLYQYVLMKAAKKRGDRELYQMAQGEFERLWNRLVNSIEPRNFDENQHVRPPVDHSWD